MEEDTLFKYELSDAWHMPIFEIAILDKKEKNVILTGYYRQENVFTIPEESLREIRNIIDDDNLFKIEEVEDALVLDGYINTFFINNGKGLKEIVAYNLSYIDVKEAPNARLLKNKFNKISKIIYENTFIKIPLGM